MTANRRSYCCSDCVALVAVLGGKDTGLFHLPMDVRFEPGRNCVLRTAIWREHDTVELFHWADSEVRHMIIYNHNRRKQNKVRLCERVLCSALAAVRRKG
jgi:hypothetical protein